MSCVQFLLIIDTVDTIVQCARDFLDLISSIGARHNFCMSWNTVIIPCIAILVDNFVQGRDMVYLYYPSVTQYVPRAA